MEKKEERQIYVAGPRRTENRPRLEANSSAQGMINLSQAEQKTQQKEMPKETTTPTTTILASKEVVKPRRFVAPIGKKGMILYGKQYNVDSWTEVHFLMPEEIPEELLDLLSTQQAESWQWDE
jgi:hypothetical protein